MLKTLNTNRHILPASLSMSAKMYRLPLAGQSILLSSDQAWSLGFNLHAYNDELT